MFGLGQYVFVCHIMLCILCVHLSLSALIISHLYCVVFSLSYCVSLIVCCLLWRIKIRIYKNVKSERIWIKFRALNPQYIPEAITKFRWKKTLLSQTVRKSRTIQRSFVILLYLSHATSSRILCSCLDQSQQIERIQKRAIHIIFNFTRGMPYTSMLYFANIETLASRRDGMSPCWTVSTRAEKVFCRNFLKMFLIFFISEENF